MGAESNNPIVPGQWITIEHRLATAAVVLSTSSLRVPDMVQRLLDVEGKGYKTNHNFSHFGPTMQSDYLSSQLCLLERRGHGSFDGERVQLNERGRDYFKEMLDAQLRKNPETATRFLSELGLDVRSVSQQYQVTE